VVVVPGETHALRGHRAVIVAAVAEWLPAVLWPTARPRGKAGVRRGSSA